VRVTVGGAEGPGANVATLYVRHVDDRVKQFVTKLGDLQA